MDATSISEIVKKIREHEIEFSTFSQADEAVFALTDYAAIKMLSDFVGIYQKDPGNSEQQVQPDKPQYCVRPDRDILCGWKRSVFIKCECPTGPCKLTTGST